MITEKELAALAPRAGLCAICLLAVERGALKKVACSGSEERDRVRAVLTWRRIGGREVWQLETFYADNKAKHQNIPVSDAAALEAALAPWRQINLITSVGDAEYKRASGGKETLLRGAKLLRALTGVAPAAAAAMSNDRQKQYILSGKEPFLQALDVSDKQGRVYDKKQSKFRQINRFLELLRDVEDALPAAGTLRVCDLCCGKSYLSFAVYHYLTAVRGREVEMFCVDLKRDVIEHCGAVAAALGMSGMHFVCGDVGAFEPPFGGKVDLVVSLHACDTATDLVLGRAMAWDAEVILSTPCCHHELNHTLNCPELDAISRHSMLRQKLCDAATDALRLLLLQANGYAVAALELIDPGETPKNIMLRAVRKKGMSAAAKARAREEYRAMARFFVREGEGQDILLARGEE